MLRGALEVRISLANAVVLSPVIGGSASINATFSASIGASVLSGSLVRNSLIGFDGQLEVGDDPWRVRVPSLPIWVRHGDAPILV